MSFLQDLDVWVSRNMPLLRVDGEVIYKVGLADRPKRVAHLLFRSQDNEVELLLWETGEVEFNEGLFGNSHSEHMELASADDLAELLHRFWLSIQR